MRKIILALGCIAVLGVTAAPAQGHTTVRWKCATNYKPGHHTNGTTRRHSHIVKPVAKHMKRHKCRKIVKRHATPTIITPAPPAQIIYVDRPVPCNCPLPEPPTPCGENRDCSEPCGDDSCQRHGSHGNKGGHKGRKGC